MSKIDLYKGDCLEVMDELIEDGIIVDAIITDPPYGTTACKWDSVIPFPEMWLRLNKLIKPNGAIVLFGSEPFSSALRMSNINNYKYDWIWEKSRPTGFLEAKNKPMKKHETISMFSFGSSANGCKNRITYNPQGLKEVNKIMKNGADTDILGKRKSRPAGGEFVQTHTNYPNTILRFKSASKTVHPTQKPVALMEYLIKTYTNEGELVLDFTMGSGTTGVACKNLNRNFIGIEMDDKYFEISVGRILDIKADDLKDRYTEYYDNTLNRQSEKRIEEISKFNVKDYF